jgi:hypothetical protein
MIRLWLVSIGWLFALAVSLPAWGDDEFPKNLKSPDAKKALQDYDKALAQAREAYEKETDAARKKLLSDLEAAQEKATKAKELDDAVRIRDFRKAFEDAKPPSRTRNSRLSQPSTARMSAGLTLLTSSGRRAGERLSGRRSSTAKNWVSRHPVSSARAL